MFESQRRLTALGLFRRVSVTELRHGDERRRDLLVTSRKRRHDDVGYGGGVEGGRKVVEEANGRGRRTVRVRAARVRSRSPGATCSARTVRRPCSASGSLPLHVRRAHAPTRPAFPSTASSAPTASRGVRHRADAFLDVTFEQQLRSSFNFWRRSASAELARQLTPHVSVSGSYQLQRTEVFDNSVAPTDQPLIDRAFPQVRLSSFPGVDHPRHAQRSGQTPRRAILLSADGQLAARAIGSEVGFVKSLHRADVSHAAAAQPDRVRRQRAAGAGDGVSARSVDETATWQTPVTVIRRPAASERFYAGGDTTIRGFALDPVGVAARSAAEPSRYARQERLRRSAATAW